MTTPRTMPLHEHHTLMSTALREHMTALRRVDYEILRALESMRHPDDVAHAASLLRDARRYLLAVLETTDAAQWEACVYASVRDDIKPLFPTQGAAVSDS